MKAGLSKAVIEILRNAGALEGMSETNCFRFSKAVNARIFQEMIINVVTIAN